MKAKFKEVQWDREYESYGKQMQAFRAVYIIDGKEFEARFSSTKKNQDYFVAGKEVEFVAEEKIDRDGRPYMYIRRPKTQTSSNYSRARKVEQSKYSGFSASYIKDMMIQGLIKPEFEKDDITYDPDAENHNKKVMLTLRKYSKEIFDHMVKIDKTLES